MRVVSLILILGVSAAVPAQDPVPAPAPAPQPAEAPPSTDVLTPPMREAITRGLDWLGSHQNPDGSWGGPGQVPVATTSVAGLALMAGGHLPGRGRYGRNVQQAIRYLLKRGRIRIDANHYYFSEGVEIGGSSRMHGHGYAVLFLAEAYGMMEDFGSGVSAEEMRLSIQRGVNTIEQSQSSQGGWYYTPAMRGSAMDNDEGSVTVTQIQALRSARNGGFKVSPEVIKKAIDYMRRSANPDGGIRYSLAHGGNNSTFALTSAGVSVMHFLGKNDMPEVKRGLEYMMRGLGLRGGGSRGGAGRRGGHFYYEDFYAVIALYQAGGEFWSKGFPVVRDELLQKQNKADGAWQDMGYGDPSLGTGFAVLSLQVPYQYLPIFQR